MVDFVDMKMLQEVTEPVFQVLRPYTRHLPLSVRLLGEQLLGKDVFDVLIIELEPFDPINEYYLNQGISKLLSVGLVSASSLVKLPQILNILKSCSVDGLSLSSYLMELISLVIQSLFNFRMGNPFQAYGESVFLALQNAFIILLIMSLRNLEKFFPILLLVIGWSIYGVLSTTDKSNLASYLISTDLMSKFYILSIPLAIVSKIPQIYGNFKNRSTGQLSSISVMSSLLGSLARIFTSFVNGANDSVIVYGYIAAGLVNLVLGIQLILYARKRVSKSKKNN